MGADMCVSVCEFPYDTSERGLNVIRDRINALNDDDFAALAHDVYEVEEALEEIRDGLEESMTEDDLWNLDDLFAVKRAAYCRDYMSNMLELMTTPGRRDIAIHRIDGVLYAISGGLSWGDIPTQAFPVLEAIATTGITDGLGSGFKPKSF